MIASRASILAEMDEQKAIIKMYQEAFPENPVWSQIGTKKDKKPKKGGQQAKEEPAQMIQQQQPQVEQVDRSQVVHDTLALVADAVILRTLHSRFQEPLPGVATQNIADSLEFLFKSFEGLAGYSNDQSFVWGNVREHFVENFSRLANKSQTQVGAHTGKTYSDINTFLHQVAQSNTGLVQKQFTKQAKPAQT